MTGLDEEILKHVRPVDTWMERELARRYLIGAINRIHKIGYGEAAIDAIGILIRKLNSITPGFNEMMEDLRKRDRDEESKRSFPESHNMIDDYLEHR